MQHVSHTYQGKKDDQRVNLRFSESLSSCFNAFISSAHRSTMLPSATEQKELNELEEPLGTSPPLELRRPIAAQRVAVPHSLQSPQDRATGKCAKSFIFIKSHNHLYW